ncbi:expressed unknown protein [Seminavis robusta]|uniref:Uncharacterized protein n=1 Tax=Seminavis robusta TaxID=568900 RepID=A0A9N8E3H0_9STRA|nr:expressed unknown protein [Seminavis robusta]|eukprot:Sro516_g158430.1 n/a (286) ;mRNA; r:6644-7551
MEGGIGTGIPFCYSGNYDGFYSDEQAVVRVKFGPTRRGPWKDGAPVGDWHDDHTHPKVASGGGGGSVDTSNSENRTEESANNVAKVTGEKLKYSKMASQDFEVFYAKWREIQKSGSYVSSMFLVVATSQPLANTMRSYSKELFDEGFESVDMIKGHLEYLQESDVNSYEWMKGVHKRIFLGHLKRLEEGQTIADHAKDWHAEASVDDDEDTRLVQIRDWITQHVIGGHNPCPKTIQGYSQELFDEGFESVEMITEYLKESDVNSYSWMKGVHKRIFLGRLKRGWI